MLYKKKKNKNLFSILGDYGTIWICDNFCLLTNSEKTIWLGGVWNCGKNCFVLKIY